MPKPVNLIQRVLFGLLVASVVAISETVLYLIWQSRTDGSRRRRAQLKAQTRQKKGDGSDDDEDQEEEQQDVTDGLRRRRARIIDE